MQKFISFLFFFFVFAFYFSFLFSFTEFFLKFLNKKKIKRDTSSSQQANDEVWSTLNTFKRGVSLKAYKVWSTLNMCKNGKLSKNHSAYFFSFLFFSFLLLLLSQSQNKQKRTILNNICPQWKQKIYQRTLSLRKAYQRKLRSFECFSAALRNKLLEFDPESKGFGAHTKRS